MLHSDAESRDSARHSTGNELLLASPTESTVDIEDPPTSTPVVEELTKKQRWLGITKAFVFFGFYTFGGSQANTLHLQDLAVKRHHWMDDEVFAELVSIGSGLPGPSITQLVVAVGVLRGGWVGGLIGLFLFVWPGMLVMTVSGLLMKEYGSSLDYEPHWLVAFQDGLLCVSVSLVAVAAWRLGQKLASTRLAQIMMIISAAVTILYRSAWMFPVLLSLGGVIALIYHYKYSPLAKASTSESKLSQINIAPKVGGFILLLFIVFFVTLVVLRELFPKAEPILWLESMYRTGSLIFGGGQVVLPLLIGEVVETGWISERLFFTGLAIIQSIPGPYFNFAAFIGAVLGGIPGALLCAVGMYIPGLLIIFGALPFWEKYRTMVFFKAFLVGANGATIGLIVSTIAILYERAAKSTLDTVTMVAAFGCVQYADISPPIVVVLIGVARLVLSFFLPIF